MSRRDAEAERLIEVRELKEAVSCAVLLERLGAGWVLNKAESTRNCLKYRCGTEVLIVNDDGRGCGIHTGPGTTGRAGGTCSPSSSASGLG